jgi:tetratricopeptide (TPR) repeat protein
VPFTFRVVNALVSYTKYIGNMLWPQNLAVIYPLPPTLPWVQGVISGLILVGITLAVYLRARKNPYLLMGWLWYLGTLVPVIGLVQVGRQAMADRYTYIPLVGLFIMIAWGVSALTYKWAHRRFIMTAVALLALAGLTFCTWVQLSYWKSDYTFFAEMVKKSPDDAVAHDGLGHALLMRGKADEAMEQVRLALTLKPDFANAHNNLGSIYRKKGRMDEAIEQYQKAIRLEPNFAYAHYNLANAYDELGYIDRAIKHFELVLRLKLPMPEVHNNLGIAYAKKGRIDQAIAQFEAAVKLDPKTPSFRDNLARARRTKALIDKSWKR